MRLLEIESNDYSKKDIFLLFQVLFILILIPTRIDNITLGLVNLLSIINLLFFNFKAPKVVDIKALLVWFPFLFWGALSFFWRVDGALGWTQSTIFFTFILFGFIWDNLVRQKPQLTNIAPTIFKYFFCILAVSIVLIFFLVKWNNDIRWNGYLGYNQNVLGATAAMLFPFAIFGKKKNSTNLWGKGLIMLLMGSVLLCTSAIGVFLSLFLGSILLLKYKSKNILIGSLIISLSLVCFIGNYIGFDFSKAMELNSVKPRYETLLISFNMFLDNPIKGIGLGNWGVHAPAYFMSTPEYLTKNLLIIYEEHNWYVLIFSELGIIGFFLFLIPLGFLFLEVKKSNLDHFHIAYIFSVIIYLICSLFYLDARSELFFVSPMQFLFFIFFFRCCT